MVIKVLGPGCMNCKKLEANVRAAVNELGKDIEVAKVTDFKDIMQYGVMRTPAVVINERVKAYGKISTVEEIKKYIMEEE